MDRLLLVQTPQALLCCIKGPIRALLPYGCMVGGAGRLESDGRVLPHLLLGHDFPKDYLYAAHDPVDGLRSPVLQLWLREPQPLSFDLTRRSPLPTVELKRALRYDLDNVLAHGCVPAAGDLFTYISFHRFRVPASAEQCQTIARLMPHLHVAFARVCQGVPASSCQGLEATGSRRTEIVRWLLQGKTNWEIAQIAATSVANVKYHLARLMDEYAVSSRAALVARLCCPAGRPSLLQFGFD